MLVDENDTVLKQKAPIFDFENLPDEFNEGKLRIFIDTMIMTMRLKKGLGLAAPQIGKNLRIFVMETTEGPISCFNPEITDRSDDVVIDVEGCLSFPGLILRIKRFDRVYVTYQNLDGKSVTKWLSGLQSRCFQHELDHLNGITFDTLAPKLSLRLARDKQRKLLKRRR